MVCRRYLASLNTGDTCQLRGTEYCAFLHTCLAKIVSTCTGQSEMNDCDEHLSLLSVIMQAHADKAVPGVQLILV